MACHDVPPFTDAQVAWLDRRIADRVGGEVKAQVRHCALCGTSPLSRVVACTSTDCPAREAQAA